MTGFQRLCLLTCAVIFGLIVLGGVVRATDSGLGCGDDWPRCEGSFIPRFEAELLIEYSHRLAASIAGMLVLAVTVWSWRSYRNMTLIVLPATLALALLLVQAGLGAAAVRTELAPEIVAVHLGMALTLLTLLILITLASFNLTQGIARPRVSAQFGQVALFAAAIAFPLMLIGSFMSGAGYGLACNGWPLCNGEVFPTTDAGSVQVHFLHRVLAGILGLTILFLARLASRDRARSPFANRLVIAAMAIYLAQALLGAANIWAQLADSISAAHLAMGTLLWSLLAVLNLQVHGVYEQLPLSAKSDGRRGLARAAR